MICSSLGKYIALEIPLPVLELDEELYNQKINEILESKIKLITKHTPIKEGDEVLVKINGYDDKDKEITFSQGDIYQTIIGNRQILKEFEQALIGRTMGESFTIHLSFPEEQNFNAGKPVRFEISVMVAYDRILPELTDEFVASLDIDGVTTVEQLKSMTKAHVLEINRHCLDETLRNTVMNMVIKTSNFEIDEDEIREKLNTKVLEFNEILSIDGISLESHLKAMNMTNDEFLHEFRENVVHQLKYRSVINRIAELESIIITDEEAKHISSEVAENYDLTFDEFILANPDGYEGVKKDILRKKVVELIISNINFIEG